VRRVLEQPADPDAWHDPLTWSDLAGDPVGFVSGGYVDDGIGLPDGVFDINIPCPVGRFSLDEKTTAKLAQYCELAGVEDPSRLTLSFGPDDVDAAEKLGAVHRGKGYAVLIAGQDVADQLAADQIARTSKTSRPAARSSRALTTPTRLALRPRRLSEVGESPLTSRQPRNSDGASARPTRRSGARRSRSTTSSEPRS